VKRAADLFLLDEWTSASEFVARTWRAPSVPEETFISVAASHWEIVVTTQRQRRRLTIRGPETRATIVPIPRDAKFFGIEFSIGTYMPNLPLVGLVDRAITLPNVTSTSVWFNGSSWEIPSVENADAFVDRLVRDGLLVRDGVAVAALHGEANGFSRRTLERRVARATGLTRGTLRQIERAEQAVDALGRGIPPHEAARRLGYADQPHLNRSLRRFVGQTPAEIAGR
jgi:hypothetical protein